MMRVDVSVKPLIAVGVTFLAAITFTLDTMYTRSSGEQLFTQHILTLLQYCITLLSTIALLYTFEYTYGIATRAHTKVSYVLVPLHVYLTTHVVLQVTRVITPIPDNLVFGVIQIGICIVYLSVYVYVSRGGD